MLGFAFRLGVISSGFKASGGPTPPPPPPSGAPTSEGLVFELLASDYTSGNWVNSYAAPADGSPREAYAYSIGGLSFVSAGDNSYFEFNGGNFMSFATTMTAFLKNMHKAGTKFTIELWFQRAANSSNLAPLFDSGTTDQSGSNMSRGVAYADTGGMVSSIPERHSILIMDDAGGDTSLHKISDANVSNADHMLAVSLDGTGVENSFLYKDGSYDPVSSSNTWNGLLSAPGSLDSSTSRLGARGDGAFRVANATRIYALRVYNRNLSKAELDTNYAAGRAEPAVVPGDPHFASVSLLCNFEGADGSTTFVDEGPIGHTVAAVLGAPALTTSVKPFGGSSLYLGAGGGGGGLRWASHASFGFGTGDFTIEGWFRNASSAAATLMSNLVNNPEVSCHVYVDGSGVLQYYVNGSNVTGGGSVGASALLHCAYSRVSGVGRLFVMGTQAGSNYTDSNDYGSSDQFAIGAWGDPMGGSGALEGWAKSVRVTKGVGRYTTNFTVLSNNFPTST